MSTTIETPTSSTTVLIVDDEPYVRAMISRWLTGKGYRTLEAGNSVEAMALLESRNIQTMTLDITMPGESGLDLLAKVRIRYPDIPVLMLTASGQTKTAIEAMIAGAAGYLIKPVQQEELLIQVDRALQWRQLWLERRAYTESLEAKVLQQTRIIREAHEETIHRLVAATMCRDEETGAHIMRTGLFSEVLAKAIGWSAKESQVLRFAAPMHDIGKIGIPDVILQKPGRLTSDEYEVMKTHTTIGAEILAGSASPVLQLAREIALCHHERWDGKGYPNGIAGESIPISARIVSIVDVYDALTHDRIYRPALQEEEALDMMLEQQGSQFDPVLLATFFTVLEEIHEIALNNPDEALGEKTQSISGIPCANVTPLHPSLVNS